MKTIQFKAFLSALLFVVSMGVYAQSVSGTVSSEDGPFLGRLLLLKVPAMVQQPTLTETLASQLALTMF